MSGKQSSQQQSFTPALLNLIWMKLNHMEIYVNGSQWHKVRVQDRYLQSLIQLAKKEGWWQKDHQTREKVTSHYATMLAQIKKTQNDNDDKMQQFTQDRAGILAYSLVTQD